MHTRITDSTVKGLYVGPDPNGCPAYMVDFLLFEKPVSLSLGRYESNDVRRVRELAQRAIGMAAKGIDPRSKLASSDWQQTAPSATFGEMCHLLMQTDKTNEFASFEFLATHLLPAWGHLLLEEITAVDALNLCNLAGRKNPIHVDRVIDFVGSVFCLAYSWGYLPEEHLCPLERTATSLQSTVTHRSNT